ncbi:MAG: thioredoxin-like domain-containing protein [Bacteroidia bacterium]
MKHILAGLSFLLMATFANGAGGYDIKLTVKGIKNETCQLAYYFGDKQYIKDSAKADINGKLTFKGEEDLPGGIYLAVTPSRKYFEILIDKEQKFSMETDTADFINNMKVSGSEVNKLFYNYLKWISDKGKHMEALRAEFESAKGDDKKLEAVKEKQLTLDKEVKDYKTKFIEEHPDMLLSKIFKASWEPEIPEIPVLANGRKDSSFAYRYYKSHYFDKLDLKDDRLIRTPVFAGKIKQYIEKLTPQIPDSINKAATYVLDMTDENSEIFKYLVYYITNTYEKSDIMGMDAVFVYMAKNYYLNGKAYWVEETQKEKIKERVAALEPCLIGKNANNISLLKPDFHPISLYNINSKYTVLYFWDPSCGHCKKVTPKLKEFYDTAAKKLGVEVMAVYIEADTTEWFKYIKENELGWINAADLVGKSNFRKYYDIYSTPVLYLMDRDKKIIAKRMEVDKLEDFIKNYEKMMSN